jgi:hypothetical protein
MCQQGHFYIFNQAPSFNLQIIIQRHIIGKNLHFFPKWAPNIGFLPPSTSMPCMLMQHGLAMHSHVMNDHIMQSHTMHGHIMHAHAVH